jgi:hypothetical protein
LSKESSNADQTAIRAYLTEINPFGHSTSFRIHHCPREPKSAVMFINSTRQNDSMANKLLVDTTYVLNQRLSSNYFNCGVGVRAILGPTHF